VSDDVSAPAEIPEGYALLEWRRGFAGQIGPLYRRVRDGAVSTAFRVEDRHTNGMRNAHGGMLMTFADMAWGNIVSVETSSYWVTVRLTCDFLSAAQVGDWVEASGETLACDNGLYTVRGRVWRGEDTLMTGLGLFKAIEKRDPRPGEKAYRG
jgi:uncharacterized protein (TIGR00369 family)